MDTMKFRYFKLEIFIPESHLEILKATLRENDAGHIGNYDSCLSCSRVTSEWRPLDGTRPYIGEKGCISKEEEVKVEVTVRAEKLEKTVEAVRKIHPYEEPVVNVIPLYMTGI